MKGIAVILTLILVGFVIFACGDKSKEAAGKAVKAGTELVSTAVTEAADSAKAFAKEAADKAKVTAKAKAAEAADAVAEELKR